MAVTASSFRLVSKTAAAATFAAALVGAAAPAAAYKLVTVGTYSDAVDIVAAPGFSSHLYVVEQGGKVRLRVSGAAITAPFLDISALITYSGEQGLLSIAFPPDHASTRKFYVQFVNTDGDIEVDEFLRSATKPLLALKSTRRVLLTVRHRDAGNHNGGRLQFDADGMLLISIGDGGATPHYSPDLSKLLGKLLRIDPHATATRPYAIPTDNPFRGQAGKRGEIWAYGFRNPWRWTLANGVATIGDVGQSNWEEIDVVSLAGAKGRDFGWPHYEGRVVYDPGTPAPAPLRFPTLVYAHASGRCAVVGGPVVAAPDLPGLAGRTLYGDYCTGELRSFVADAAKNSAGGDAAVGPTAPNLRSFGTDASGRIHLTDGSTLFRLAP